MTRTFHVPALLTASYSCHGDYGRRGEEAVHRYSWSIERNDKALLDYFFVQEHDPPLLCALDLPGVNVWDGLEAASNDHELYGPGGPLCIPVRPRLKASAAVCTDTHSSYPLIALSTNEHSSESLVAVKTNEYSSEPLIAVGTNEHSSASLIAVAAL